MKQFLGQYRCIKLPFEQSPRDGDKAMGPEHYLTVGRVYNCVSRSKDGQWLLLIRGDGKEGSYHASNFEVYTPT